MTALQLLDYWEKKHKKKCPHARFTGHTVYLPEGGRMWSRCSQCGEGCPSIALTQEERMPVAERVVYESGPIHSGKIPAITSVEKEVQ